MDRKLMFLVLGLVLVSGVLAANELTNVAGIDFGGNMVGGGEILANFSFDYEYLNSLKKDNEDRSEFILKLNFSSNDSENYPVWQGDFEVRGWIDKNWFSQDIEFNCSDAVGQQIVFEDGVEDLESQNGTFWCVSEKGELRIGEHDDVYLEIVPNIAIWPGSYNLSAEVYYLTDEYAPVVDILNDGYFDGYFGRNDKVDVWVNVSDRSDVVEVVGYAFGVYGDGDNLLFGPSYNGGSQVYEFQEDTQSEDLKEGDYDLVFYAKDEAGNIGNDSAVLKIDLTGPEIDLVEPTGSAYSEVVPFKFNVTDEKAGVDYNSVKIRLRQYVDGFGLCPSTGGMVGGVDCVTTDWISLGHNVSSGLFELDLNVSEYGLNSSEYWIDAVAEDVLQNKVEWVEDD